MRMRHYGINRDPDTEAKLRQMYLNDKMSTSSIAAALRVGTSTVTRLRAAWGIPTRVDSLVGKTFERWTVIEEFRQGQRGAPTLCRCGCSCGGESVIPRGNLISGVSRSCGCLHRDAQSRPPGEAMRNSVLSDYRLSAKRKGLIWALSNEEAVRLFVSACRYCAAPPSRARARPDCNGSFVFNGIDRVDTSQGYEPDNVVPACTDCNYAKGRLTAEAFLAHVAGIREIAPPYVTVPGVPWHPSAVYPYCRARRDAEKRGFVFFLSREQAIAMYLSPCVYCGVEGSNRTLDFRYNGIDRVDNVLGYIPENTVPCCMLCNRMKRRRTVTEFLGWAARVRSHTTSISTR